MKQATITQIKENTITLIIDQQSMCAHCQIKSSCSIKECAKKEITIKKEPNKKYKIGQTINIDIGKQSTFLALFYAYLLPLIIMLTTFYSLTFYNINQTKCGLFAIISLIPYYFLLSLFNDKLDNKIKIITHDN